MPTLVFILHRIMEREENFILDYPDFGECWGGQISDIDTDIPSQRLIPENTVLRHYGGVTKPYGNGMFQKFHCAKHNLYDAR